MTETHLDVLARIIAPEAWAFLDAQRKLFPADPPEQFKNESRIRVSLEKAATIMAIYSTERSEGFTGQLLDEANNYVKYVEQLQVNLRAASTFEGKSN